MPSSSVRKVKPRKKKKAALSCLLLLQTYLCSSHESGFVKNLLLENKPTARIAVCARTTEPHCWGFEIRGTSNFLPRFQDPLLAKLKTYPERTSIGQFRNRWRTHPVHLIEANESTAVFSCLYRCATDDVASSALVLNFFPRTLSLSPSRSSLLRRYRSAFSKALARKRFETCKSSKSDCHTFCGRLCVTEPLVVRSLWFTNTHSGTVDQWTLSKQAARGERKQGEYWSRQTSRPDIELWSCAPKGTKCTRR